MTPLLLAATIQLAWQAATVDTDAPGDCLAKFKSNRYFGWIVFAGVVAGKVVA